MQPTKASDFEAVWKERKSTLLETPGFIRFALLKGDAEGEPRMRCLGVYVGRKSTRRISCALPCCSGEYVSESVWASREDFEAWRGSQRFGAAHGSGEGKVEPCLHVAWSLLHTHTHAYKLVLRAGCGPGSLQDGRHDDGAAHTEIL